MAFSLNTLLDSAGGLLGLGGDPLATPIGRQVLAATSENLDSIDWNLNLSIVDQVNNTDDGPREAVRAIRRRIQNTAGKDEGSVFYSLVLTETLAKNCGKRFHLLICSREFSNELVNKIIPLCADGQSQLVQDKILSLVQSWAHAFSVDPELQGVAELYLELKKKGVEFPPPSDDDILLVQKNQMEFSSPVSSSSSSSVTVSPARQSVGSRPASRAKSADQSRRMQAAKRILSGNLTQRQMMKLNEDLRRSEGSISVLSELLAELIPGQEDPEDLSMLLELEVNCKEMQARVLQLLQILEERETVQRLLDINDNFNNVFIRFERFKRSQPSNTEIVEPEPTKPELIPPTGGEISRPVSGDAAALVSRPDDFQEIEEWMKTEDLNELEELEEMRKEFEAEGVQSEVSGTATGVPAVPVGSPRTGEPGGQENSTTEEFEKFLVKRAEAADQL